jgi:cytidyltransferase-like protein
MNQEYSLFIGRYQPLHDGHEKLIRTVLNEGKRVCIGLRDLSDDSNPFTLEQRKAMFHERFGPEMDDGRMVIVELPNIVEVCYGRKVGWSVREIKLDAATEAISATAIRAQIAQE